MKNKFYAVKVGVKKGVYTTWLECKKNVDSYPNAIYKSFSTMIEAENFLNDIKENDVNKLEAEDSEVLAYIDGSYNDTLKRFSYAALIFCDGEKIAFSNCENNSELIELRNVAGELKAAMYAMDYTFKHGKKKLKLFYDYSGIEMWATGDWRAKLKFTQEYVEYVKQIQKIITISFVKIKSHSGDKYNEEVDKLAKSALQKCVNNSNSCLDIIEPKTEELNSDLFSNLKGNKTTLNLHFKLSDGSTLVQNDLMKLLKMKWKSSRKSIKDIQDIKALYDIETKKFVFAIYANNEEYIYTIESG